MLNHALFLLRNNFGEIKYPTFDDERFEFKMNDILLMIKKRSACAVLVQYFLAAVWRKENLIRDQRRDRTQRIGTFLLRFFRGEGQAINYIEDVSVTMLETLTNEQMEQIIAHKHLRNDWGPVIKWKDDMWYDVYNRSENWVFLEDIAPVMSADLVYSTEYYYDPYPHNDMSVDIPDLIYEPIYQLEESPANPFGIEPSLIEWMESDDFTYN